MKEFMLIFIGGEAAMQQSPEEMQKHMQKWFDWVEKLKSNKTYLSGEALTPGGKTVKGPKAVVTDGPFAESKEVVGGYFVVKAPSLEEAVKIAKDSPDLPFNGSVEVREIMKFDE